MQLKWFQAFAIFTFSGLAIGFAFLEPVDGFQNPLEKQFFEEAPNAWKSYTQALENYSCNLKIFDRSSGSPTSQRGIEFLRRDGETLIKAMFEDHRIYITGINRDYSFGLSKNGEQPFLIKETVPTDNLKQPTGKTGRTSLGFQRIVNPTFLIRESLEQIVRNPIFELTSIQQTQLNGFENLVLVEFNYKHPFVTSSTPDVLFNSLQGGKLWLDMDNHWAIVRFEGSLLEPSDNMIKRREIEWEFSSEIHSSGNIKLPSRVTNYYFDDENSSAKTRDYSNIVEFEWHANDSPPPAEKFRLSHYGFTEPPNSSRGRNSYWRTVLVGTAIGLGLMVVAIVLRKSGKKG